MDQLKVVVDGMQGCDMGRGGEHGGDLIQNGRPEDAAKAGGQWTAVSSSIDRRHSDGAIRTAPLKRAVEWPSIDSPLTAPLAAH